MQLIAELYRARDLLALRISAENLELETSDPKNPKLTRVDGNAPAYLIYEFQPQSIFEQAYFEAIPYQAPPGQTADPDSGTALQTPAPPGQVQARITHPSRLVFAVPANLAVIPFTVEGLLNWSQLQLEVVPVAQSNAQNPVIVEPGPLQSAIEFPYRLFLSPNEKAQWIHATQPVTHHRRTELWYTQLPAATSLRAVWSPDYTPVPEPLPLPTDESPFRGAMNRRDRAEIVILTSAFTGYLARDPNTGQPDGPFVPTPITADRFMLSSLGGWLTSDGRWNPPISSDPFIPQQVLDVSEWRHIATQGRDHYVRIVYEGVLYPFGHRASLVKVTERKVQTVQSGPASGSPAAYLRQYMYIIVRQPERTFSDTDYNNNGRAMPLRRSIRLTTIVTPHIDLPAAIPGTQYSFWVYVATQPFKFHVVATDVTGRVIDFTAALVFVPLTDGNALGAVRSEYANRTDTVSGQQVNRRRCEVESQKMAYADPTALGSDDTSLTTSALHFDIQNVPGNIYGLLPTLDHAEATIPAVDQILGTTTPTTFKLFDDYVSKGLDQVSGVFADLTPFATPALQFSADKAGGIATPNLSVAGLSALSGPVGGKLANAAQNLLDPGDFFDLTAQLFGSVTIKDLLSTVPGLIDAGKNGPKITAQVLPDPSNPQQIVTSLHWSPQPWPPAPATPSVASILNLNNNQRTTTLTIDGKIVKLVNAPASQGTFDMTGVLTNFQISLAGVIGLNVSSITFTAGTSKKTSVQVQLDNSSGSAVVFEGALDFVNQLGQIIPSDGFGEGPSLDVTPSGVTAGYSIGLPPIGIGVFSLENVLIDAALTLPFFSGKPQFDFYFAKRDNPFLLTVELLGGGGFLHVEVDTSGPIAIEGQLEFGGNFSIDLGVASGGVHIMAGIYFKLAVNDTTLSGFVDMGGELDVLGIISISVDFNLSLTYDSQSNKVTGRATLTVSVHVLFFSTSVQLSVERSYGSGSGDPSVKDVLPTLQLWQEYAAAFAA